MAPLPLNLPNFREWWDSIVAFFHAVFKPKPFRPRIPTVPEATESTELNAFGFVSVPGYPLPIPPPEPSVGSGLKLPEPKKPPPEIPHLHSMEEDEDEVPSMWNLKSKRSIEAQEPPVIAMDTARIDYRVHQQLMGESQLSYRQELLPVISIIPVIVLMGAAAILATAIIARKLRRSIIPSLRSFQSIGAC